MLRLGVDESRLEFDRARIVGRICQRQVPSPPVSPIPDRHLCSDAQWRGDKGPQSIRQLKVSGISQGLLAWICSEPEIQSDDRGQPTQGHQVDPRGLTAFDPTRLRTGDPRSTTDLRQGQSR